MVIPTLNEEQTIGNLLNDLSVVSDSIEVIIVDGGSQDLTLEIAKSFLDIKIILSTPGRAKQMNKGARQANGEYVWFVHSDSRLNAINLEQLLHQIKQSACSGSCYLEFDKSGFWYRLYSRFSRINWSIFTYGDQGIFVKKSVFFGVGGYRQIPIMEDIDIVRRIKRRCTFKKLNLPIVTSSRRFEKNGVVWQEIKNIALVFLYLLGVSPYFLKRFY